MVNRSIAWAMREAAVKPEKVLLDHERGLLPVPDRERSSLVAGAVTMLLGPKVRFLAGAALLAGCIAWMHQNAMISAEHAAATGRGGEGGRRRGDPVPRRGRRRPCPRSGGQPTRPLDLPGVPPQLLTLVSSFGAGVGGLILIVSSFFQRSPDHVFRDSGRRDPGVVAYVSGTRRSGGLDPSLVPSIVGAAILAAGILFGRR